MPCRGRSPCLPRGCVDTDGDGEAAEGDSVAEAAGVAAWGEPGGEVAVSCVADSLATRLAECITPERRRVRMGEARDAVTDRPGSGRPSSKLLRTGVALWRMAGCGHGGAASDLKGPRGRVVVDARILP